MLLPLHDDNPLRRIRFGYLTVAFSHAAIEPGSSVPMRQRGVPLFDRPVR